MVFIAYKPLYINVLRWPRKLKIRGLWPPKRGQKLNQFTNLRGHGHKSPQKRGHFLNAKKPSKSRVHPKNYEKNMKTRANRIRKLLAYLYYSKKSRPSASLSGGFMLFIFDGVSYVFKRNFEHFITFIIVKFLWVDQAVKITII